MQLCNCFSSELNSIKTHEFVCMNNELTVR